jgi:uncharacterized protein
MIFLEMISSPMRKKEKEIRSQDEIERIIKEAHICRLGLSDKGDPYIVPVCFGFKNNKIYIHSAPEGRKLDILRENPRVCFEIEVDVHLKEAPDACGWNIAYKCVMGAGTAVIVCDDMEKRRALSVIMKQYSRKENSFEDIDLTSMAIIRIDIQWMTGKAS